ncbi:diacylglycerol kinase [Campylobacter sp. MIT 21-1685]|uniref:diacylglycerol kinase n=1 Tax=unclassified Campylobacter TaxID=2593542 RepID=UPI00224B0B9B|nr:MULTISPECIES: diacylglycerol kinase [unclassified Campylobacter]MCX2683070.1 diacylglycerol kinase [Campylobacter sp. MIT 21-1684]MCX2751352.1 diacylglycerol kinase [Campylobacter sp. MIT 21-1682]MCX2807551.1 diacylglycerol kinase [Campylobacter sp. MIT 21-1685]
MKPKYHFFKNALFALEGVKAMMRNEKAFRLELCVVLLAFILSFFLSLPLFEHLLIIAVLFFILIAEAFNSAVEACVDLITDEWHEKAKIAKDCASAGVFFSIVLALITWVLVLGSLWI